MISPFSCPAHAAGGRRRRRARGRAARPQVAPRADDDRGVGGQTHLRGEPFDVCGFEHDSLDDRRRRVLAGCRRGVLLEVTPGDRRVEHQPQRPDDVMAEPRSERPLPRGDLAGAEIGESHVAERTAERLRSWRSPSRGVHLASSPRGMSPRRRVERVRVAAACGRDQRNGSYTFTVSLTLTDGGTASATRHFTVAVPGTASAIAAGLAHTCALTSAGGVKCWGGNFYGQLGNWTTATPSNARSTRALSIGECHGEGAGVELSPAGTSASPANAGPLTKLPADAAPD
jgi:hypothetical protein